MKDDGYSSPDFRTVQQVSGTAVNASSDAQPKRSEKREDLRCVTYMSAHSHLANLPP